MSTLKADTVQSKSSNTDLTIAGDGSGVPNLEAGFKVGGVAGVPTASIRDDAITSAKIADDAVVTAAIADDAITAALMADDAVGNPVQLWATGTAVRCEVQFLRGDNSWAEAFPVAVKFSKWCLHLITTMPHIPIRMLIM